MVSEARKSGAIIIRMDPILDLEDKSFAGMLQLQAKSGEALPRIIQELRSLRQEEFPAPLAPVPLDMAGVVSQVAASAELTPSLPSAVAAVVAAKRGSSKTRTGAKSRGSAIRTAGAITVAAGSPAAAIKQQARAKKLGSVKTTMPLATKDLNGSVGPAVGFFVYGSLRPDDDSGKPWTKDFCQGLAAETATLTGASLYVEGAYPSLCLERTRCEVRGVLLTPENSATAAEVMADKLEKADAIEGYPSLYDRAILTVETNSGEFRRAYVYHRTGRVDRSEHACIPDGDWMSRKR